MTRFLPFRPEFRDAVVSGRKTLTSRTKKCAERGGEVVETPFGPVEIVAVSKIRLGYVRDALFEAEGCDSPEDFERVWREIHPRAGFDSQQMVWTHMFVYLGSRPCPRCGDPCDVGQTICDACRE